MLMMKAKRAAIRTLRGRAMSVLREAGANPRMRGARLDAGPRRSGCAPARFWRRPSGSAAWRLVSSCDCRDRGGARVDRRHLSGMRLVRLSTSPAATRFMEVCIVRTWTQPIRNDASRRRLIARSSTSTWMRSTLPLKLLGAGEIAMPSANGDRANSRMPYPAAGWPTRPSFL